MNSHLTEPPLTAESLAEAEEALYQRFKARMLAEMRAQAEAAQRRYMNIVMKMPRKVRGISE
jgi:hypothetical protein